MDTYSYLSNVDSAWLDDLYQQYQKDPASVETGWARFFEGFEFAKAVNEDGTTGASVTQASAKAGSGQERPDKANRSSDCQDE